MSWYRIYRPQTVASLHITPVREAFSLILSSGEFSHAYLLTGPKGTGKTSGARILAKILNCEKNRDVIEARLHPGKDAKKKTSKPASLVEPCNSCSTCIAITNGSSLCVSEMDAASNRGIDDIRELTGRIGLSAGDGPMSVIIIDEVHMLTTEAFNALLKVLEEPPAHVVFILATTDPQKMPQTVISRCRVIQYRKATSEEMSTALSQIAKIEHIKLGDGVLLRIVTYADGSFRDGVKAFEQVASGKSLVELDDVSKSLGASVSELAETIVQFLAKRNYQKIADVFAHMEADGIDVLTVQKEVLRSLHARMIAAPAAKNPHFPVYVALVKSLNVSPSPSLPFPGLPFEIAALEWCLQGTNAQQSTSNGTSAVKSLVQQLGKVEAKKQEEQENARKKKAQLVPEPEIVVVHTDPTPSVLVPFSTILEQWHVVLTSVREKNGSIESLLKTTKPLGMENNVLKLEVFYQFHKDQLMLDRNLTIIEEVLARTFAAHIRLEFVLGVRAEMAAKLPDSNLSGIVDLSFVKAAEDAFLS